MGEVIQFKPKAKQLDVSDDRLERIRHSLNKINKLMSELKQMSKQESENDY
jgi:hypothetical protein